MIDFGTNFRKLREQAGLSQEAVAISFGLSTAVVNRIENNKRKPDLEIICKFSEVLHAEITEVLVALITGGNIQPRFPDLLRHYQSVIEEKNKIIHEKDHYIRTLEDRLRQLA